VIANSNMGEILMASKIILDSPSLLEESLISLTAACKYFPRNASRASVERWIRRGSRGVVLESILVCGRRMTSVEAVDRFIRNQLQTAPERAPPETVCKSKKELDEAAKRFGLPVSQD